MSGLEQSLTEHAGLIRHLARKAYRGVLDIEDLEQEARIEFAKSFARWRADSGVPLSNYASMRIRSRLFWATESMRPRGVKQGRPGSKAPECRQVCFEDDEHSTEDTDPEKQLARKQELESLGLGLNRLPPDRGWLLRRRFLDEATRKVVGEERGISQAHVWRLENDALESLRRIMEQSCCTR